MLAPAKSMSQSCLRMNAIAMLILRVFKNYVDRAKIINKLLMNVSNIMSNAPTRLFRRSV